MKNGTTIVLLIAAMFWSSCRTEKALWIEVNERGGRKTIAMTEAIARKLLEWGGSNLKLAGKDEEEVITKDMLRDVLDGRQQSITATDNRGSVLTLSMRPLRVPGERRGDNRLVLETYKDGKQTFRMALPEFTIQAGDDGGTISINADVDWKSWLPFLSKAGGAVFIKDEESDTEVWVYVE